MDSRLLNMFHEDAFEGNFVKYETEPSFWPNDNDDMSMQLTDTLNGILPILPTDAALLQAQEEQEPRNRLMYNEFEEQQLSERAVANMLNAQVYQALNVGEVGVVVERENDDTRSQCSNSTFRTRTDSSSIADYESHPSDYDDEEDDVDSVLPLAAATMQEERKRRTFSSNTMCSDGDGFGLNFDANSFDLADFITKDDFASNVHTMRTKEAVVAVAPVPVPIERPVAAIANKAGLPSMTKPLVQPKRRAVIMSDDDSDTIIDVETVDVDESLWVEGKAAALDDLCYVDNVKADPSWCPKQTKKAGTGVAKEHKAATQATTGNNNNSSKIAAKAASSPKPNNSICLVPNKKQCDFLKRKVGAKTASSAATLTKSMKVAAKRVQEATKQQQQLTANCNAETTVKRTGLGLGGKNLALIKHERDSIAAAEQVSGLPSVVAPKPQPAAPKRKLNLAEYKQRRGGGGGGVVAVVTQTPTPVKQAKMEPSKSVGPAMAAAAAPTKETPHKAAISSIVSSLKCPTASQEAATDPITVAKNKVLRMLELKRAQQLKILDSRVSAKVPRVTKLPPLKDIVKDTYCMQADEPQSQPAAATTAVPSKLHPDYEEIIIVSASCNTDITIPPFHVTVEPKGSKTLPSSRSLLKSSVLLYNMSNGNDASKNMTNSLIASIQREVVKQTSGAFNAPGADMVAAAAPAPADPNVQHGEDMVIMHLPKDRVRKRLVSMSTQTELQPEFPMLTLPVAPVTRKSRERTRRSYRKRRSIASNSNGSCSSSSSSTSGSNCSSLVSCRSRSNSNSAERLRHCDATAACGNSSIGGGCGYSSRSTHRHRSSVSSSSYSEAGKYERQQRRQRRTSYNKRRSKNHARSTSSTSGSEYGDRSRSPQRPTHSRSRSRSRSRSNTPTAYGSSYSSNNNNRRGFVDRNVSQPAVEERRIVYVGRIEQETTKELLRRKFLPYGSIKQITIHYKENGMKYGFVTFERAQDAFTAIDSSPRDVQINMYDISFGGRRAFCRASYADLDNAGINNYQSYVFPKATPPAPQQEDSFEALLLKVKAKLNAGKPAGSATVADPAEDNHNHTADNCQI